MDLIIVFIGLIIALIFLFKIEWLFATKTFLRILAVSIILFLLSLMMVKNSIGNPKVTPILMAPLFSAIVFFCFYKTFYFIYKRNPENTMYSFTKKPINDIVFTMLFWIVGVGGPIVLVKYIWD